MKRSEAEFVFFWRQLLAGEFPPLARRLAKVDPEASAALVTGLARLVVRYLLAQGGAHPDESLTSDRRFSQRALWSAPHLTLDFRQPLLALLAQLAATGKSQLETTDDLGVGGEVALLMIADELALRPRADLPLQTLASCGALAWLAHGCEGDRPLPAGAGFEDALFFARGRLATAWLELDPVCGRAGPSLGLPTLLARADQRARVWSRYRERVWSSRRFDLLAPLCAAATTLWASTDADALMARVEEMGRFAGESPRQDAYQRLLAAYQWMEDLEDWAAQARSIGPYDEEHYRWQVYLAYYGRMPKSTHQQSTRLLAQLRRTL
jgi:hypothetical protein